LSSGCFAAEKGMPQLDPKYWLSQIFWVVIIFSLLYLILWRNILPKINENLENRKSQILNDIDEAQKFRDESEKKISEYNKILNEARQTAKNILDDTRKKINRDIENKEKQFNLDLDKEIKNAEKEIESLKQSSIKDVNNIAIQLSADIVKTLVGAEVNRSSVSAIVEDVSKKEVRKYI